MAQSASHQAPLNWSTRIGRGVLAGIVAGVVFAAATMMWTAVNGPGLLAPLQMIASIPAGGTEPTSATAGNLVLGLIIHMALSVLFGVVFLLVVAPRLSTSAKYAAGAVFGLLLYVINFQIVARAALPVFLMAHQGFEVFIHVVFGLLLVPFVPRRPQA